MGRRWQVAWIPREHAVVGRTLPDGWLVEAAWTELPASVVLANERDYLRQRMASDI